MAEVWAESRQEGINIDIENIVWFGSRILENLKLGDASVAIVITDASGIRELNREFLGRDKPTNVISFPMKEGEAILGDEAYLGDVVLSGDAARTEAMELGYEAEELILLYMIHGILHLSGYNHEDVGKEEAERMEDKQMEIFNVLVPLLEDHPLEKV